MSQRREAAVHVHLCPSAKAGRFQPPWWARVSCLGYAVAYPGHPVGPPVRPSLFHLLKKNFAGVLWRVLASHCMSLSRPLSLRSCPCDPVPASPNDKKGMICWKSMLPFVAESAFHGRYDVYRVHRCNVDKPDSYKYVDSVITRYKRNNCPI